jgi:predicted RNA-binding protein with RPS1 domain
MILDEATSSIDTRTEALVQKGMDGLMYGRTVFVIAHRLSTVQNSDIIMVLELGRIIERGTHQELIDKKVKSIGIGKLAQDIGVGIPTLEDIVKELEKPGRDPRDELPPPLMRSGDVMELSDLKEGMELMGTVRNVIDFGAFVDIGVHEDGLVHISQMCSKYIKHPLEAVSVGDIVDVQVLDVELDKKRISLSMKLRDPAQVAAEAAAKLLQALESTVLCPLVFAVAFLAVVALWQHACLHTRLMDRFPNSPKFDQLYGAGLGLLKGLILAAAAIYVLSTLGILSEGQLRHSLLLGRLWALWQGRT